VAQLPGKIITNPNEALVHVGKENTELHEEVQRLYIELDWYRTALTTISKMPNAAADIAKLALQKRPFNA
jgi:hypothetical protein